MPPKVFPSTKRVTAKGKTYLYFRTGQFTSEGKEILARLPASNAPDFGSKYAAMMGVKTKRSKALNAGEMTVTQLANLYEKSPKFTKLSEGSKKLYRIQLDVLRKEYPTAPAGRLERQDIALIMDKRADRPGAANSLLSIASALYSWGRARGHVKNNPTADIEQLEVGEWEPWPDHVLQAALTCDDDRTRLATHLLFYTAQRIGDVVRMRWTDIRDGAIQVTQQKTGKVMSIRLHSALVDELARHKRDMGTILTRLDGRPITRDAIRNALQEFAAGLGAKVVPHGLRKNAVNALLEAGCSVAETSAISGQSLAMVEHYAKGRAQGPLGSAAILKWERKK